MSYPELMGIVKAIQAEATFQRPLSHSQFQNLPIVHKIRQDRDTYLNDEEHKNKSRSYIAKLSYTEGETSSVTGLSERSHV